MALMPALNMSESPYHSLAPLMANISTIVAPYKLLTQKAIINVGNRHKRLLTAAEAR